MNNNFYNRYALAFLKIAIEQDSVQEYRKYVKEIVEVLKENKEFLYLLSSKSVSKDEALNLIGKNFKDYPEVFVNYLNVIYLNGRFFYAYPIFKETLYRFDDYLKIERGTIYSSKPLSEEVVKKIENVLEKNINKKIELANLIDKNLIGGFKIILKNDIYDTSVNNQIDNIKKVLLEK